MSSVMTLILNVLIQTQYMWDFWLTKWHGHRPFSEFYMVHIPSTFYSFSEHFGFSVSVSFQQCSILTFCSSAIDAVQPERLTVSGLNTILKREKTVWWPSPCACKIGPHVNETISHLFFLQCSSEVTKDPCRREEVDELISMTHTCHSCQQVD
jgi:hypothetical protein